jgi:hypothetical protein
VARRIALAPSTPDDWPRRCAQHAHAIEAAAADVSRPVESLRAVVASAQTLTQTLRDPARTGLAGPFRRGDVALATPWIDAYLALHDRAARFVGAYRTPHNTAPPREVAAVLPSLRGDAIPVSMTPGAVLAGVNNVGGVLSVLFIDASLDRIFCRSRDRGASMRCRRFAHGSEDAPVAAPRYLISNDAPEALLLSDRPGPAVFSAPDAFATALFLMPLPLLSSLPARVVDGALYAVADDGGRALFVRCERGGTCTRWPADVASLHEAVIVSTQRARAWWIGRADTLEHQTALTTRALSRDAPGALTTLAPLGRDVMLLAACQANDSAYAVAVEGARAHVVALRGDGTPRHIATARAPDLPFELVCDARGVTLAGATTLQSCGIEGRCTARVTLSGTHRVARIDGDVVLVTTTRDGGNGLRVRRASPEDIVDARVLAVADDAAHGGVSAHALWIVPAGDRLVMFAASHEATVVLYSDDGLRWMASREALDEGARPMRLGSFR